MSQNNESCLRFSLEESVWFQKGQEVAELVSISLDPNITIHENEQYVTIQGALELTGEFTRFDDGTVEEEDVFSAPKFIHQVEEREGGILEFFHRFPVDITIPNNRIQSVEDIHIEVESFDYLFQERSCMKLIADLTITGLYGDQQHKPANEDEEIVVVENFREEDDEHLEATEEIPVQITGDWQDDEEREVPKENFEPFQAEARKVPEDSDVDSLLVEHGFDAPQVVVNEAKEPEVFFSANRKEVTLVQEAEEVEEEPEPIQEPVQEILPTPPAPVKPTQPKPVKAVAEQEVESSSSSPAKPVQKKKKTSKKGLSLTEFFARKEEGDELVKLRVAIVQEGETLEQLASRYSIGVHQLLKVNQLELSQDIYEGQVLYIPVAVAHK